MADVKPTDAQIKAQEKAQAKAANSGKVTCAAVQVYNPLSDMQAGPVQFTFQEFKLSPWKTKGAVPQDLWNAWGTVTVDGVVKRIPLLALKESENSVATLTVGQTYTVLLKKNARDFLGGSIVCKG
jgi:hypothetical protein